MCCSRILKRIENMAGSVLFSIPTTQSLYLADLVELGAALARYWPRKGQILRPSCAQLSQFGTDADTELNCDGKLTDRPGGASRKECCGN